MRSILLIVIPLLLVGCSFNNQEKYELKSPCVAADIGAVSAAPCMRQPINSFLLS